MDSELTAYDQNSFCSETGPQSKQQKHVYVYASAERCGT